MSVQGMSVRYKEWAIVLLATRGLTAFVENALIGVERCGIDTGLVQVVFPANAECELLSLTKAFGARPRILEQLIDVNAADMPASYTEYGTKGFNHVMKYRFPVLRAIMAEGMRVIYADVDVAWLRNPLPYLSDVLDHYPCAIQTEGYAVFPPSFCLGFLAVSHTSESLKLINEHITRYVGDELKRVSQPLFRELIVENPQHLDNIFPLPEGLFPNGVLYGAVASEKEPPVAMSERVRPFIIHANCTGGLENKRRLLASIGAWFVPENVQNGAPITLGDPIPLFSMTDFRAHNTAKVNPDPHLEAITPAEQWAYALSFPANTAIAQSARPDQSVSVQIELCVDEGCVGVGLLKADGCDFLVEKAIPSGKGYFDLTLRAPMLAKFTELVIRNRSETNRASRVTVRSIATRLLQRGG